MSERAIVGLGIAAVGLLYGPRVINKARVSAADRMIGPAATRGQSNNTPGIEMLTATADDVVKPRPPTPVVLSTAEVLRGASSQFARAAEREAKEVVASTRRAARRIESALRGGASGLARGWDNE